MSGDKVSKIEHGTRSVSVEELLAFAEVLGVPLERLLSALDGELAVRVTDTWAEESIGNWMIWGKPWTEARRWAEESMSLFFTLA